MARALTPEHKRRMQEGRRRARAMRPQRLAEVESQMDELGAVYKAAKGLLDYRLMAETRQAIAELGRKRVRLQEGGTER